MLDDLAKRIAWAIETIKDNKDLDKGISDVDLAKILGTNKNTLANYRQGKGSLMGEVIDNLIAHYKFNPMWLFKGEGEPFPGARYKYPEVCGPEETPGGVREVMAGYDPALARQKINIEEAVGKAYKILSSGTALAAALYLNVQQFAIALDTGHELKVCQDQISGLQTQINDLRGQVDRLTASPASAADFAASSDKKAM